jgi:prepilin-type N-terminal cleavage/methylation domain-containing protein
MSRSTRKHRERRGFTLIELVIAMSVGGVISFVAATIVLEGSQVMRAASARASLCDNGARAIEMMLRYVREVTPTAPLGNTANIATADAADLRFDTYGFRQNGSALEMTEDSGANWHRACDSVTGLTFRYYDTSGTELTALPLSPSDRGSVRQISVELQVSSAGQSIRLRSRVYLREFMHEAA